jgi:hypothetical protein
MGQAILLPAFSCLVMWGRRFRLPILLRFLECFDYSALASSSAKALLGPLLPGFLPPARLPRRGGR